MWGKGIYRTLIVEIATRNLNISTVATLRSTLRAYITVKLSSVIRPDNDMAAVAVFGRVGQDLSGRTDINLGGIRYVGVLTVISPSYIYCSATIGTRDINQAVVHQTDLTANHVHFTANVPLARRQGTRV